VYHLQEVQVDLPVNLHHYHLQVLHQESQVVFHPVILVLHLVVFLVKVQVDHQVFLHQEVHQEAQVDYHLVVLQDPLVESHQCPLVDHPVVHLVNHPVEAFTLAVLHQIAQLRV